MKSLLFIAALLLPATFTYAHIGQFFILTLPEKHNQKTLSTWLENTKPAGVMLLASHVQDREKTKQLTTFLQKEAHRLKIPPLIIATDWEGGIVSRPTEAGGFHSIPSPWALAQLGRQACFQAAFLIGVQMRSVGITMNFGPSLDLFGNHILATRCFNADPEKVAECGIAFARGLLAAGVIPVIKHFPGLGSGQADTHDEAVSLTHQSVKAAPDTQPFLNALQDDVFAIMPTHATCNEFGSMPITQSKKAVDFLRKQKNDALLITDDFCMAGAYAGTTQEKAIKQALSVGYDLVIFSGKPAEQIAVINALQNVPTVPNKKARHLPTIMPKFTQPINEAALANQLACSYLQTFAIQPINNSPIIMITTDLPKIRPPEKWFIADGKSHLHKELASKGASVIREFIINPVAKEHDATSFDQQWRKIEKKIAKHPEAVILVQSMLYANGDWNNIQKSWFLKLAPYAKQLCIISLGHPEEQKLIPEAAHIPLGSFHKPLLQNLAQRLTQPIVDGIDIFTTELEKHLCEKRFGLLCNKASRTNSHQFLPDMLHAWAQKQTDGSSLAALFSPEHGLLATHSAYVAVASEEQSRWGCPVHSLHGEHKKPTSSMLKNIDIMIIDLPDIGMRCFTYLSTLDLMLQACAEEKISVIVLDKHNPLNFWGAAGPAMDEALRSFLGRAPTQFMHGSTIGTIAQLFKKQYSGEVTVIAGRTNASPCAGWHFTPPSPNLMTIDHLQSYPCTVLFEGTNYSEGRGTNYPFLQIGAPWVNGKDLAEKLNGLNLAGVYFEAIRFTPKNMPGIADKPKHEDRLCQGVFVHLVDKKRAEPATIGPALLKTCFSLYPKQSQFIFSRSGLTKRHTLHLLWGQELASTLVSSSSCTTTS